jgi:4-hydroxy-tetrahydrodipicolinate synthase
MRNEIFKGIFTALITPFSEDGNDVDLHKFKQFVEWQIDQGIHGLVPCGTTGETPVLNDDEYKSIVTNCIETAKGQCPIIVGAGANNTSKSVAMAEFAYEQGADAILVVSPYYNKPSQDGLYAHFETVAKSSKLPVIVYNIPGRSVVDIAPETMKKLSQIPNIIGVKDATGDLTRVTKTRLDCGENFTQLSGEDATIAGYLAQGGHGAISVLSNCAPKALVHMYEAYQNKDMDSFGNIRDSLFPLAEHLFMEPSPAPVKFILSQLGFTPNNLRLPLLPITQDLENILNSDIERLSLTKTVATEVNEGKIAVGHGQ